MQQGGNASSTLFSYRLKAEQLGEWIEIQLCTNIWSNEYGSDMMKKRKIYRLVGNITIDSIRGG
jgi:hypothetical protein